jgi:hypothetical protein
MHLINLTCETCGWQVHALMGGANGTTPERARAQLIAKLRWARDGHHCGHCRAAQRSPRPHHAEACA